MGAFSFAFSAAFDAQAFAAVLPLTLRLSPSVVKHGDMHSVVATIRDQTGAALDIAGSTVRLLSKPVNSETVSILASGLGEAVGTVVHGLDGTIPEGIYLLEAEVTLAGAVITAPMNGYAQLRVMRDFG